MLVTSEKMLLDAQKGRYAVGAFNAENLEMAQAIVAAAEELRAPVMIQTTSSTLKYASPKIYRDMVAAIAESSSAPVCMHLDHGDSFELCKSCVDGGFTSVMIDASHHSFEENIKITSEVVQYAHDHGVVVEAELGQLAGIEDAVNVSEKDACYTDPNQVEEFVGRTGVDSLAIAIGTSHGAFKFKTAPRLRFDILEEVGKRLPGFPIVLHGASSIPQEYVETIEKYGGSMPGAKGVPEDMLREAARMAVCKINVDSDLRMAATAAIREHFYNNPSHFDPRQYLGPARAAIKECVRHKLIDVLGCAGKA